FQILAVHAELADGISHALPGTGIEGLIVHAAEVSHFADLELRRFSGRNSGWGDSRGGGRSFRRGGRRGGTAASRQNHGGQQYNGHKGVKLFHYSSPVRFWKIVIVVE